MWRFRVTSQAQDDIANLDAAVRRRILAKLSWFQEHFEEVIPLPLTAELRGFFKLRSGDWRIVYGVDEGIHEVTIHMIDRRDRVYKRR